MTRWTWVWVNSGSWWWTGRPGVLQFMGSQRVWHEWATELNWMFLLLQMPQCFSIVLVIIINFKCRNVVELRNQFPSESSAFGGKNKSFHTSTFSNYLFIVYWCMALGSQHLKWKLLKVFYFFSPSALWGKICFQNSSEGQGILKPSGALWDSQAQRPPLPHFL